MNGAALRHLPMSPVSWTRQADVVIVGSGAAGMSAALEASALGRRVLLVSKAELGGGSTPLAQGGLAAVLDPTDSAELHVEDTVIAGAGLCDRSAVEALVRAAPREVARLESLGARFDDGPLGLEGGHSRHRIVHSGGDASGAEVHRVLAAAVAASPIEVFDHAVALDALLDAGGAVVGLMVGIVEQAPPGEPAAPSLPGLGGPGLARLRVGAIMAGSVVLASGGYGQAYATTTNPAGATGDGLALAIRAGAEVTDVEFVQFHPTVLWQPRSRGWQPLITEALRGAGATIVDVAGRSVMSGRHPLGDLAPRDVVAATMHRRMTTGDGPSSHLWLDATALGRRHLEEHFPTVTAACRARGIDPTSEPIPVAPGAHYACGGIRADMAGRTSLAGLYAIGEVAATGVHGANRLASNSLTEAIAMGRNLGRLLGSAGISGESAGEPAPPDSGAGVDPGWRPDLADAMSRHAGVVRHGEGLEHLLDLLGEAPAGGLGHSDLGHSDLGRLGVGRLGSGAVLDLETVETTNLHTVATVVALAALARTESRGCHRRSDAPDTRTEWDQRLALSARNGAVEVNRSHREAESARLWSRVGA